jgi:ABC-2 type transport system ATP-binding protein
MHLAACAARALDVQASGGTVRVMTHGPVLRLLGVGKDYGARVAVRALDLEVERGECFALLGPNGAGKTTALSMAAGVIAPSRGRIEIAGIDLRAEPFAARAKLGLVPQELALYDELSAVQNLGYFGALYGLAGAKLARRIDWALEVVGLRDRARERVRWFSGGMKRRLNIAAGLVHRPAVVFLDEPTVGVDPQSRNRIFATVRALRDTGTAVVYTSHYMEEVEALCDRVAIIDAGSIVASGRVRELVRAHEAREIALELTGPGPVLAQATRAAAAHAAVVRRDGATLWIAVPDRLAPVIAAIEGAGAAIARIESPAATLETAFLALTGRALRDAS